MKGKRIKQINNLTITIDKEGCFRVYSPHKELLKESKEIRECIMACRECKLYLKGNNKKNKVKQKRNKKKVENRNRDKERELAISSYTGEELKGYVNNAVAGLQERDFVKDVSRYFSDNRFNKVYALAGLRGTGKTTGILQAIDKLNKYDECVFITIDNEDIGLTALELKGYIEKYYSDKKYIIIDEITRLKGAVNGLSYLADKYVMEGKRVVISGTDSYAINLMQYNSLYHRVEYNNITFMSYSEYKRIINEDLYSYLKFGGLFKRDRLENIGDTHDYIQTAVIDNITNTIKKNKKGIKLISKLGEQGIRTIVFSVIYSIIYNSLKGTHKQMNINPKLIIDKLRNENNELNRYKYEDIIEYICERYNLERSIKVEVGDIYEILDILIKIGVIVDIININDNSEEKYYLTNPSIYRNIVEDIISILNKQKSNEEDYSKIMSNIAKGLMLESIIMVHANRYSQDKGYEVYYYNNCNREEIDLIISNADINMACYEIKLTSDAKKAIKRAKWITDKNTLYNVKGNCNIIDLGIIYMGNGKRFKGKKLRLINAEEFILGIDNATKSLEEFDE